MERLPPNADETENMFMTIALNGIKYLRSDSKRKVKVNPNIPKKRACMQKQNTDKSRYICRLAPHIGTIAK